MAKSNLLSMNGIPTLKGKEGFRYPSFWEWYKLHDRMHWTAEEINLNQDVIDYSNASPEEAEFIKNVMKEFTQQEIMVDYGYAAMLGIFKPLEVQMMLANFMAREGTHIENYSLFTETIGLSNSIYTDFLDNKVMRSKMEYVDMAKIKPPAVYENMGLTAVELDKVKRRDTLRMVAVYGGFTEGISLFAQFASLLKFKFDNKYKGLANIVEFSLKEESIHNKANSELFRVLVSENLDIWDDTLKYEIYQACREIVDYEKELIREMNPPHMDVEDLIKYIEYCANNALKELGMKANYNIETNPLPYMDDAMAFTLTDFFSSTVTEYTKQIKGSWDEVVFDKWKGE